MFHCLALLFVFLFSCNHKAEKRMNVSDLYRLIEKYDPAKEYEYYNLKQAYPIGDSLNNFFKALKPDELMNDTNFRKPILFLLEKKYLYIVTNATKKDIFYVTNATNWWSERTYNQFALNVFSKIKLEKKYDYTTYINRINDVVCIDLIVNEAAKYNLITEEHKKIHNACIQYMPTKCLDE